MEFPPVPKLSETWNNSRVLIEPQVAEDVNYWSISGVKSLELTLGIIEIKVPSTRVSKARGRGGSRQNQRSSWRDLQLANLEITSLSKPWWLNVKTAETSDGIPPRHGCIPPRRVEGNPCGQLLKGTHHAVIRIWLVGSIIDVCIQQTDMSTSGGSICGSWWWPRDLATAWIPFGDKW
jgi:hypothetical protein